MSAPTWQGRHASATRDRFVGILCEHEDGSSVYLQPGDDTSDLGDTLDSVGITVENIDVLICDQLEGIEPK